MSICTKNKNIRVPDANGVHPKRTKCSDKMNKSGISDYEDSERNQKNTLDFRSEKG